MAMGSDGELGLPQILLVLLCFSSFFSLASSLVLLEFGRGDGDFQDFFSALMPRDGKLSERLSAFDKVSSLGLIALGVISLAKACGVPVHSILTVGGIGGVATAFAASDILGNMLSGFSLKFSRPLSVGDYIKVLKKRMNTDGMIARNTKAVAEGENGIPKLLLRGTVSPFTIFVCEHNKYSSAYV